MYVWKKAPWKTGPQKITPSPTPQEVALPQENISQEKNCNPDPENGQTAVFCWHYLAVVIFIYF